MLDISASATTKYFLSGWIARFGLTIIITTDHGRQFESELFTSFSNSWLQKDPYNPQSDVEQYHHILKSAFQTHLHQENYLEYLPLVLLGLKVAVKQDINCS